MFQRDTGLVNAVLSDQLHLVHGHPFWLLGGNSFAALVIVEVWRLWPFAFLTSRPACRASPWTCTRPRAIDGAGCVRRLRSVTLPMLRPVNSVLLLVLFLWTFNDFNTAYILFDQPPAAGGRDLHPHLQRARSSPGTSAWARRCRCCCWSS